MEQVLIQDPTVSESLREYGVVSSCSNDSNMIYNEEDVLSSTSDCEISSSSRNTNYRNDEDRVTSSTDYDTVTSSMDSFINGDTDSEVTSTCYDMYK